MSKSSTALLTSHAELTKVVFLHLTEIDVGETVTWTNEDIVPHKIATWDGPGQIGQTFQSPVLNTGDTFSYTFAKSGTFWYYSPDYEWAEGRVIVRGDSQGSESDRTERESDLATENQRLRQEISSLRNQVDQLEQRIQDLQSIIMEQLKVIVDTLKTIKGN